MPVDYVNVAPAEYLRWSTILEVLADCIKLHVDVETTGARVYPYWVYEIDAQTMLGKVTAPLLAASGTSEGSAHCWCLGIEAAQYLKNAQGVTEYVGADGARWDWVLTVAVWGFRSFDGKKTTQQAFLDEVRLVSAGLFRNAQPMREGTPKLGQVRPLEFTAIQPTPFSDGSQISVASGAMQVVVQEGLQL